MASLTCDLGETEHILGRNTLDLFICSHLQITLLHDSLDCNNLEKLVTAGFWITRGNGLSLSARLYLDAFDGLDFSLENFADGLSNMLCTSKVVPWSSICHPTQLILFRPALVTTFAQSISDQHHAERITALSSNQPGSCSLFPGAPEQLVSED